MQGSSVVTLYRQTKRDLAAQIAERGFINNPMPSVLKHGVWLWTSVPDNFKPSNEDTFIVVEVDANRIAP